jgi:hypothetical protein
MRAAASLQAAPRAFAFKPITVGVRAIGTAPEMTVRDALNSAIDEEMERDPMVFIMGAFEPGPSFPSCFVDSDRMDHVAA